MRRTSFACAALMLAMSSAASAETLRVCADSNNMPFSDSHGGGFENKIAEIVARDLHMDVAYAFAAQRETFVKKTLNAHKCDVMIGAPVGFDDVEETEPYYASTYVFVSRKDAHIDVRSLSDPRLRKLRIGVHLIGGENQPPEIALGEEGIVGNVSGFMINGDRGQPNPPAKLIEAVEHRDVDVAAAWGPLAGYYAMKSPVPLTVVPMTGTERFAPLEFRFAIAMGVRKGDEALKNKLEGAIARQRGAILAVLRAYGVPLLDMHGGFNG